MLGVVAVAITFGITLVWLQVESVDRAIGTAGILEMAGGIVGATLLWGVIGVGVGAMIRNQVGAIVGTIIWLLIPGPLIQGLYPKVGHFLPNAASDAFSGSSDSDLLSPAPGGLVLAGWAILFVVAGALWTARRDVP